MFKRSCFAVAIVAMLVGAMTIVAFATEGAQYRNNGYITVVNQIDDPVYVWVIRGSFSANTDERKVFGHQEHTFNALCCYVAGTTYVVKIRHTTADHRIITDTHDGVVTPRLCNRDGIPYGYASLIIERSQGSVIVRQTDKGCP